MIVIIHEANFGCFKYEFMQTGALPKNTLVNVINKELLEKKEVK